jgi:hypothetical protein
MPGGFHGPTALAGAHRPPYPLGEHANANELTFIAKIARMICEPKVPKVAR